jgi:hypothetical protein
MTVRSRMRAAAGWPLLAALAALSAAIVIPAQAQKEPAPADLKAKFTKDVAPLITKHCAPCHSGENPAAGIDFAKVKTVDQMTAARSIWDRAAAQLRGKSMPPARSPQPTAKDRERLLAAIEVILTQGCGNADPGRATIRRLNRREYNNTVHDLLGVSLSPADEFPNDDIGYGFDNIGDVLMASPLLTEQFITAAEKLAEAAIVIREEDKRMYASPDFVTEGGINLNGDVCNFFSYGTASVTHEFKSDGYYTIKVRAYGQQAGPDVCKMSLQVGPKIVTTFDVAATTEKPVVYEVPYQALKGRQTLTLTFVNDFYDPKNPDPKQRDRNLAVMDIEVVGTPNSAPLPKSHTNIIFAPPIAGQERESARAIIQKFGTRAYRRPITVAEVDRLLQLYDLSAKNKEPFESSIRLCVTAILSSPHFLYRVELDNTGKPGPVDDYALASRLSYFLWSTMPDDELMRAAAAGELSKPALLGKQVDRMIASPKIQAMADGFAMQWLELERLKTRQPDPTLFPTYSEDLRDDMLTETKMFFMDFVRGSQSAAGMLNAPYSFVNERLAKHYGLSGVTGNLFRKVDLSKTGRAGLLTQASILTVTSNPTRTSPVKRGKWVLEQILGTPPPSPPPGADAIAEEVKLMTGVSFRKKMELHRADPACATCHKKMDPLGFGLENFDGVGAWRTEDAGQPVDSSGELPGGIKFTGAGELRNILMGRKKEFLHTLTEKLMIYALGRGVRPEDKCFVDEASASAKKETVAELIKGIVMTNAFRMKGAGEKKP